MGWTGCSDLPIDLLPRLENRNVGSGLHSHRFAVWTFASSQILPAQCSVSRYLLVDIEHVSILMPDSPVLTPADGSQAVLIGPEGGWSNDDESWPAIGVIQAGWDPMSFGRIRPSLYLARI